MSLDKSQKELAFLHDLYVATDWGERFAELVDEHVKLPEKGRVLYVSSGTGGHALALKERAGEDVTLIGLDENEEYTEIARAKSAAVKAKDRAEFGVSQLESLSFEDDGFDLVIGDASMVAPERLPEMLSEMVRVAAPGATVALTVATASSFGEFFSIYWEALSNTGQVELGGMVENLINELPTVSDLEALAARETLDEIQSWTRIEEFDYTSGEDFLEAPLFKNFLFERWLEPITDTTSRADVLSEVARIIDHERSDAEFPLSIKATLVTGRKPFLS